MRWLEVALLACIGLVGAAAVVEAYNLGLVQFRKPGAGLFPFVIGALMCVLSLGLAAREVARWRSWPRVSAEVGGQTWRQEISVLAMLFAYAAALPALGFALASVALVAVLIRLVGRKSWLYTAAATVLIVAPVVIGLGLLLKMPLPGGRVF